MAAGDPVTIELPDDSGNTGKNVLNFLDSSSRYIQAAALTNPLNGKFAAIDSSGNLPVTVASLPLPTGAATSSAQTTGNNSLSSIDGKITAVNTGAVVIASSALPTGAATSAKQPAFGTAGSPSSDVISIQGVTYGAAVAVTGTVAISGTISVSGTVSVTGVATATHQTDGSQKTQVVDGSGNVIGATASALDVNIKSSGITVGGGTEYTEDVASATDPIGKAIIGRRRDTLSATEVSTDGDNIALNATAKGQLHVFVSDAVAVTGTFWQATQPVSVASLPLPSGASTSTKQSDGSQKTQVVDGSGNVIGATSNALDVNIKSGAAAGTQYTEDVASAADPIGNMLIARRRDTLTAAEVSTDGDNIALNSTAKGQLEVHIADTVATSVSGTVTISGTSTVTGNVADGGTDSGNPVKVAGRYNTTKPTYSDGQRGDAQIGTRGSLIVQLAVPDSTNPIGNLADSADAVATSTSKFLAVMNRNTVFNGTTWDRMPGSTSGLTVAQPTAANLNATVVGTGTFAVQATLAAETTKVIGVTRSADGSGNLLTSTGNALDINIKSGNLTTLPVTNAGTFAVQASLTGNTSAPAAVNITVVDSGTSTTGNIITGTPTANSFATFACSGYDAAVLQVIGTFVGTVQFERSNDGGVTYTTCTVKRADSSTIANTATAPNVWLANVAGFTHFRVRCTAYTSGTIAVTPTFSTQPQTVDNYNALRLFDNTTGGQLSINTGGNAATNVAQLAGTAIDVNSGNKSAGTQRFVLATDQPNLTTALNVALAANQSVNNAQVSGTTVSVNNGTTDAGTQRVTLSSDSTGQVAAVGKTASGSSIAAAPVTTGGQAKTSLPTAVADGQVVNATYDKYGRQVVVPFGFRDLTATQTTTISASTSETTIVTAAASTFNDIALLVVSNTSASTNTRIDFRDTTGGSVLFSIESIGGAPPVGFAPSVLIPQTSVNTNWTAQCATSTTDVRIYVVYVKDK